MIQTLGNLPVLGLRLMWKKKNVRTTEKYGGMIKCLYVIMFKIVNIVQVTLPLFMVCLLFIERLAWINNVLDMDMTYQWYKKKDKKRTQWNFTSVKSAECCVYDNNTMEQLQCWWFEIPWYTCHWCNLVEYSSILIHCIILCVVQYICIQITVSGELKKENSNQTGNHSLYRPWCLYLIRTGIFQCKGWKRCFLWYLLCWWIGDPFHKGFMSS